MDRIRLWCIFITCSDEDEEQVLDAEDIEASAISEIEIVRYHEGEGIPADDVVAREEPLEVRLNGRPLVYLMRLPGDDVLLAAGFCFSEGLISERSQIELLHHCLEGDDSALDSQRAEGSGGPGAKPGNLVEIRANLPAGAERFEVARVIRTGCGGADLDREVDLERISVESEESFPAEVISRAPDLLLEGQPVFQSTGGTHGAGVFDASGNLIVVKEDVGRHNAVDKVLGYLLLSGLPVSDKGLVLSGRLSYEMVLKAARAGIPLVCSVSAPTALGVEVGRKTGVTMVGFVRGASFNVYCNPGRVVD